MWESCMATCQWLKVLSRCTRHHPSVYEHTKIKPNKVSGKRKKLEYLISKKNNNITGNKSFPCSESWITFKSGNSRNTVQGCRPWSDPFRHVHSIVMRDISSINLPIDKKRENHHLRIHLEHHFDVEIPERSSSCPRTSPREHSAILECFTMD